MSVGFIDEEEKEDTVPVAVSFTSGEKVMLRLPVSAAADLLKAYTKATAKSQKRVLFATSTGVVAFDLTHVSKIDVGSRSKQLLARMT